MCMENINKTTQIIKKCIERKPDKWGNTFNHAGFYYKNLKPMSIFACIYGFFHCSCTENSVHAPFAWQWTHAWSNVCYLKPPHLVTHRIRNEIKKKKKGMWDAGMVHGFGFAQEIPPVICVRLSKCRDLLWQFYTAPDGKQSFPPSHWLQAWHSIETLHKYTQTHTHAYMNTSIPSEPLWQINMPENHRDWFRTVFKVGQTRATVKFTVPPEARQHSILETNQNGKLVTRVSANLSVRHQNHTRGSL